MQQYLFNMVTMLGLPRIIQDKEEDQVIMRILPDLDRRMPHRRTPTEIRETPTQCRTLFKLDAVFEFQLQVFRSRLNRVEEQEENAVASEEHQVSDN